MLASNVPGRNQPGLEPTREAGLKRLAEFLPRAGHAYRNQRNFDLGPGRHEHVSGLSPYLRHRLIGEWEVVAAVLSEHGYRAAEKFIQEVFWRVYWKGWLEQRPRVWHDYLEGLNAARRDLDASSGQAAPYREAVSGRTGIAPFDAWARELVDTGYLHNHARMWFASIWTFTLRLPWELGAAFFMYHLLDGDAASNTLSWRWVAGLQTPGKYYLATPDNIERFAGGRFFNTVRPAGLGRLVTSATVPAASDLCPPEALNLSSLPEPGERAALLLHVDDLQLPDPEMFERVAVLAMPGPGTVGHSNEVEAFRQGAVASTVRRASASGCSGVRGLAPAEIPSWISESGIERVYMPYVPQGPLRDQIHAIEARLSSAGCELHMFAREIDIQTWPYSHRGFFSLKKHIPRIIEALGATTAR
ncbi:MAG: FAD-binding domain-containing protein [Pseudomonadota bacterium]